MINSPIGIDGAAGLLLLWEADRRPGPRCGARCSAARPRDPSMCMW